MLQLAVLVGQQGAGKTTFYLENLANTHVLVSKDRISSRPKYRRQMLLIDEALSAGRSVCVDNTNPELDDRSYLISAAKAHKAEVVAYWFDVITSTCMERNKARRGKACVPDVGFYRTKNLLTKPTKAEGFDRIYIVRNGDPERWVVEEENDETTDRGQGCPTDRTGSSGSSV